MTQLVNIYQRLLSSHPWKVTCLTSGALTALGDIICQQAIEKRGWNHFDFRRNMKMMCLGIFVIGPGGRQWFLMTEKLIPGVSVVSSVKKMILHQITQE